MQKIQVAKTLATLWLRAKPTRRTLRGAASQQRHTLPSSAPHQPSCPRPLPCRIRCPTPPAEAVGGDASTREREILYVCSQLLAVVGDAGFRDLFTSGSAISKMLFVRDSRRFSSFRAHVSAPDMPARTPHTALRSPHVLRATVSNRLWPPNLTGYGVCVRECESLRNGITTAQWLPLNAVAPPAERCVCVLCAG